MADKDSKLDSLPYPMIWHLVFFYFALGFIAAFVICLFIVERPIGIHPTMLFALAAIFCGILTQIESEVKMRWRLKNIKD